jgi:hypothetical protein
MNVTLVTMWAYPRRALGDSPLWQSCHRYGMPLVVLQEGERFVDFYHNKVIRLLADVRQLDFDALIWADADDAFIHGDPRPGALAALDYYAADFVVGAEANLWPWHDRLYHRFPKVSRSCHPNAGVWAATRQAFIREYERMIALAESDTERYEEAGRHLKNDDQALFMEWMASGRSGMVLDTQEKLVLNLNALGVPERGFFLDMLNDRLPPLLHGPGQAKALVRCLWAKKERLLDLERQSRWGFPDYGPERRDGINSCGGLVDMLRELPPLARVAEVGCYKGVSTEVLALFADHVFAVDHWPDPPVLEHFQKRMQPYRHVQALHLPSRAAAAVVPDGSLDLVYIDADHQYASVREDIAAWLPKVRPGGFVAGHDYATDVDFLAGVVRAVDERFGAPHRTYSDRSWLVQV